MIRVYLMALVSAVLIVAAGCGSDGGTDSGGGGNPEVAAYYQQISDIVFRANELSRNLVRAEPGDEAAASYVEDIGKLQKQIGELTAPEEVRGDHQSLVEQFGRFVDAAGQAGAAVQAADGAGQASATESINASLREIIDTLTTVRQKALAITPRPPASPVAP